METDADRSFYPCVEYLMMIITGMSFFVWIIKYVDHTFFSAVIILRIILSSLVWIIFYRSILFIRAWIIVASLHIKMSIFSSFCLSMSG